ncbi:MAG: hypothetical protein PHX21_09575 [bacterium]|nr:hypothetical protein [bacterium]
MFKSIVANKGLKVFSFLTAVLLWFYVATEKIYEKEVRIPVFYTNLRSGLSVVKLPPQEVQVTLKGSGKELLWVDKRLKIILDLSSKGIGWHRIDLKEDNINIPNGSKIIVKEPPNPGSFVIRIDKRIKKQVKIVPDMKNNYITEINPSFVEITGGSGDVYPISAILTEQIPFVENFPETLHLKLLIPEDVTSNIDSVIVILKPKL